MYSVVTTKRIYYVSNDNHVFRIYQRSCSLFRFRSSLWVCFILDLLSRQIAQHDLVVMVARGSWRNYQRGVRLVYHASGCFRPKGGVVTGRCFKQMGYRRIGLEILGLKMPLIEMHDLFARQLELQLDDNRPSHVFGFAMVTPMFMDEINLYTTLISIKGYSICAIHASCYDRSVRLDEKPQVVLCRSTD